MTTAKRQARGIRSKGEDNMRRQKQEACMQTKGFFSADRNYSKQKGNYNLGVYNLERPILDLACPSLDWEPTLWESTV